MSARRVVTFDHGVSCPDSIIVSKAFVNCSFAVLISLSLKGSSAEIFALAGVKIANSFDNVTHLAFGCETENFELLKEIAKFFANEPKEYKEKLKKFLKEVKGKISEDEFKKFIEYVKILTIKNKDKANVKEKEQVLLNIKALLTNYQDLYEKLEGLIISK